MATAYQQGSISEVQQTMLNINTQKAWTGLVVVAAHAQLQHLIKTSCLGQQAAQAPECTAPKAATANALVLPIAIYLQTAGVQCCLQRYDMFIACLQHGGQAIDPLSAEGQHVSTHRQGPAAGFWFGEISARPDLEHADARADVHQQVRVEVRLRCTSIIRVMPLPLYQGSGVLTGRDQMSCTGPHISKKVPAHDRQQEAAVHLECMCLLDKDFIECQAA